MLTLNNVRIFVQEAGVSMCVYLVGTSKEDIEARYLSFWQHQTTNGELMWKNDFKAPYFAYFWVYGDDIDFTASDKIKLGLARGALFEMLPPNATTSTKGHNPWPDACAKAEERYNQIPHVHWLTFRMTEVDFGAGYSLGDAVKAEKDTGNFDDDVLSRVVTRQGAGTLEMLKQYEDTESATEEEESACQNV